MSLSTQVRQSHRWLSVATLLAVVIVTVVVAVSTPEEPAGWVYALPVPPVLLLLGTGLYLFALPYSRKRRGSPTHRAE